MARYCFLYIQIISGCQLKSSLHNYPSLSTKLPVPIYIQVYKWALSYKVVGFFLCLKLECDAASVCVKRRNNCLIKIPQFATKVKINSNVCGAKQTHLQNGCSINQNTIGPWYVSGFLLIIGSDRNGAINPPGEAFRKHYIYTDKVRRRKNQQQARPSGVCEEIYVQLWILFAA